MDEDSKRLLYEARLYSEQLRLLENEVERISMTAVELTSSLSTISSLEERDAFVPIGGGSMISAKVAGTNVLVPIGGGYMVGFMKDDAVEEIRKRIKSTETAVMKLQEEFNRVSLKLREVNTTIESQGANLRGGK